MQVDVNGQPCYPFPQTLGLIKNNNLEALDLEGNNLAGDYVGLQSLESWSKYGFLMSTSFEYPRAWINNVVSGYPNPTGNLLTIKYSTTFSSTATDNVYLLGFAERVVRANFQNNAITIDY